MHSHDCKRDYLFWKTWIKEFDQALNPFLVIDFAENLSLSIYKEPQSMYWVRKQISIHSGVGTDDGNAQKIYFGHISEDRTHDQSYILLSAEDAVSQLPAHLLSLVLRSDNASNFKCAEAFHDMQKFANKYDITLVRVYGIAGHGKSEVDSCGGHLKTPARKHIAKGNILRSAKEVCSFLSDKYDPEKYANPLYHTKEITKHDLDIEREKRRYMKFDMVSGSDSFHVLIFKPNQDFFYASPRVCVCEDCLAMDFDKCSNFQKYIPSVGQLSKKHMRSAEVKPEIVEESITIVANSVVAVRADNGINNFFLVLCDQNQKTHDDPDVPLEDKFGHKIFDGTAYIKGHYLVCSPMNKCHVYTVSKTKAFVTVQAVFFPYVPILETTKSSIKIFNEIVLELQVRSSL